jgi:hypothetical protein
MASQPEQAIYHSHLDIVTCHAHQNHPHLRHNATHEATHEGILQIGASELKVYRLNTGQRVIEEESLVAFLEQPDATD